MSDDMQTAEREARFKVYSVAAKLMNFAERLTLSLVDRDAQNMVDQLEVTLGAMQDCERKVIEAIAEIKAAAVKTSIER